ncbi:MAG: response regulator [Butyrivibrio sp.]|nr:response regulator [Butyrivibrio sp.]
MERLRFPINKKTISFIIIGISLDIICYSIMYNYSMPFFLDTIGTFLVSVLLGPVAGSIVGILNNIICARFGMKDFAYFVVSIAGAVTVSSILHKREHVDSFTVVGTGVLSGIIMTIAATPVNMIMNNGYTGNIWGDALTEMLSEYINLKVFCCVAGELIVNIPDKMISILIVMVTIIIFRKSGIIFNFNSQNTISEDNSIKNEQLKGLLLLLSAAALFSMAFPIKALAGNTENYSSTYATTIYGLDHGLNSAELNTVTQTTDGYIWAGAYSGLYRYDGTYFEKINLDPRITSVTVLHCDNGGKLWIGTNDAGLACYDPYKNKVYFYSRKEGLCADYIRGICEDENGDMYVSTTSYICKICLNVSEGEGKDNFENPQITVFDDYSDLVYTDSLISIGNGQIAGIAKNGLLFLLENDKLKYTRYCTFQDNIYHSVAYGENGIFVMGTSGNYLEELHLSKNGFTKTSTISSQGLTGINEIRYMPDMDGYFIGCDNGFGFVSKDRKTQNLSVNDFNMAVSDIIKDKQGNIWFTSTKQGLLKFSENPFVNLFNKVGLGEVAVNSTLLIGDVAYIGTDEGLVKINIKSHRVLYDEVVTALEGKRIRNVMQDSKKNIWISTYDNSGLVKIEYDGMVRYFSANNSNILGTRFRFCLELSSGKILTASSDGISFISDNKIIGTVGAEDGIVVTKVLSALEEDDGSIWIGTDGDGVYKIQNRQVVDHYDQDNGLMSQVVMKVVPCDGGRLYVGSNGIYYHTYEDEINKLQNFPYSNNYDVIITEDKKVYVSSSAGVFVLNEKDMLEDKEGYSYTLLGRTRGLNTTLNSNSFNCVKDGQIYFCCTNGVQILNTEDYMDFDSHYQILLRSVAKEGEEIEMHNGVYYIPPGSGQVEVTPAILNYTISDPLVRIEMEGIDDVKVMRQSALETIYYGNLPYGNHRLTVKVINDYDYTVSKQMVFLFSKEAKMYEHTYYKIYLVANIFIFAGFIAWLVAKMGNMALINSQYRQIREAKEEAENANKAKSQFLAQMSHEIRTPINAVLGMDEMILRESSESEIRGYASDIYNAGQTLLSLINDILDSSKIESGKMEIVPVEYELASLLNDLVNMITPRAQAKDLKLKVQANPELPKSLFGDDVRIRQIITNILTNAVKYTMAGEVILKVDGTRLGDTIQLHVEVEDTGIGIKPEDIPKLTSAYQRIEEGRNRKIEGTGLGLNITAQLLDMMGSRLEVTSTYGTGSKFFFDLNQKIVNDAPMGKIEKTVRNLDKFGDSQEAFTAEEAKVLVVDDNAMNRKVFRSLLKPIRIQISEAASGPEALTKVDFEHFDIIFMDHMMPGMDGVEAMKLIKEKDNCKDIPIYALTANAVTGARESYISMGFTGFISKPVMPQNLEAALKESLPEKYIKPLTEEEREMLRSSDSSKTARAPEDLPDVDGLDWNYAWLHLPDVEMIREAVTNFYDVLELQAERLQTMYENIGKDNGETDPVSEYRIQVHAMKSSAATIGIVPLAGMAKVLEFAAKDGNLKVINSMHEAFINEWRSYEDKLKGVFGLGFCVLNSTNGQKQHEELKEGSKELLLTMFDLLRPAMEELDVDSADDIMAKMGKYKFGDEIDALVPKLNAAVKGLDEEMANKLMDEMESKL